MIYKYQARNKGVALKYAVQDLGIELDKLCVWKVKKKLGIVRMETVMIKLNSKIESMVIDFLEHALNYMGIEHTFELVAKREDQRVWISIDTQAPALLIGNKGKTLDSLQLLANMYVRRITDRELRVVLDVHDYRERRMNQIKKTVYKAITDINNGRESVLLSPMSSFDRQLVHKYISDSRGLSTKSENADGERCVRIMREHD